MKAIVSEKGQVTIPKALRDRLGIRPGQVLDLEAERDRLVATRADSENGQSGQENQERLSRQERLDRIDAALLALTASADIDMTSDEYMALVRGPREDL